MAKRAREARDKSPHSGKEVSIGGVTVPPGARQTINLELGELYNHNPITMPVHVVNGRRTGPRIFISAAIHGDELNGVEIVRRLLKLSAVDSLRGTLIAVPIVNVLGVLHHSRYLPDRRDLNRSFPGSDEGSLTARLARLFVREIVRDSDFGIDIHTGALHRENLPHVRADLSDRENFRLARVFGAPVVLHSGSRDGSLREYAGRHGVPLVLYESGEALRFDETAIRAGLRGVVRVLRHLEMLAPTRRKRRSPTPLVAEASSWVRAPRSGIVRMRVALGTIVEAGDVLCAISDPFGQSEAQVSAPNHGVILGRSNLPLAYEGDALFHIAEVSEPEEALQRLEAHREAAEGHRPLLPEPPIV